MNSVPLGELGNIVSGSTPKTHVADFWDGEIPWVTPADLSAHEGIYFQGRPKGITQKGLESCSAKMLPAGSILFSSRAPIGHCAVTRLPLCTNQGFKSIVPNKRLHPVYGYFALKFITPSIIAKGRGATFAEINKEIMEEVRIPYRDISEQRRIAGQLEQADRLCRTRRYALGLSDGFLPAAFLELFGDPVRNTKGWPCTELEVIASVDRGKFTPRPRGDPTYYGGKFPFIQTGDISRSGGRLNSWTQTLNERGVKVSRSFPPRTVVIAIVGATIGMTAILELEVYCTDSVVGIQADTSKATPEYVEMLLRFWRPVFLAQAPETARANINLDTLRPLRMPVPPLVMQEHFAALVVRHERLRATQREALRQAEHLFQTLLHRAFSEGV